jgi:hypothetical protein
MKNCHLQVNLFYYLPLNMIKRKYYHCYTRQQIEQAFDIGKTFAGLLPIGCHKEETISGTLIVSFCQLSCIQ